MIAIMAILGAKRQHSLRSFVHASPFRTEIALLSQEPLAALCTLPRYYHLYHATHYASCCVLSLAPFARLSARLTSALRRIIFVLKLRWRPGKLIIGSVSPTGIEHLCREDKHKAMSLRVHVSSSPASTRGFPERKG